MANHRLRLATDSPYHHHRQHWSFTRRSFYNLVNFIVIHDIEKEHRSWNPHARTWPRLLTQAMYYGMEKCHATKKGASQSVISKNIQIPIHEWEKDGSIGASHLKEKKQQSGRLLQLR